MVKAFAPVVTCAVLVAFRLDRFDLNVVMSILVIVAGCFTASYGNMDAKSAQIGLACMLLCEVAEAFRSAGMQYLLNAGNPGAGGSGFGVNVQFSLFDGMYYFSPATLLFLGIMVYFTEWEQLRDPEHLTSVAANPFAFLGASCLGFFVNLVSLAVIQNAGSLTLKIVSQLKNAVVILAAVVVYDDVVSAMELAGYAVAVCGFVMYQDAKKSQVQYGVLDEAFRTPLRVVAGRTA
jgi:drug/metabolite transporter (DMT)-like permease